MLNKKLWSQSGEEPTTIYGAHFMRNVFPLQINSLHISSLGTRPLERDLSIPCNKLPSRHYFTEEKASRPGYNPKSRGHVIWNRTISPWRNTVDRIHISKSNKSKSKEKLIRLQREEYKREHTHSFSGRRLSLTKDSETMDSLRSKHEEFLEKTPKVGQVQ